MLNPERADIRTMSIEPSQYIREEWEHIFQNRVGNLCGSASPTERQIQIAKIEADAWAAKQRKAKAE